MIFRALVRSMLKSPGRCLAALCLVAVAVTVHAGTLMGINRVQSTTDWIYEDLRLFDVDLRIRPTPAEFLPDEDRIKTNVRGVTAATWRLLVPGTAELSGDRVTGAMILAVSPHRRPAVSDWRIVRGSSISPEQPEHVVIDSTFAADMSLEPGDHFTIRLQGREQRVMVSGIGVSPEFLLMSVNDNFQIPVRRTAVAVLMSQDLIARNADISAFDMLDGTRAVQNSLAVKVDPALPREEVRNALRSFLTHEGAMLVSSTWSEEQYSVRSNHARLSSFRGFLPTAIAVFAGLTFLVLLLLVQRMMRGFQRETAILLSLGVSRSSILLSWILTITTIVVGGAAFGTVGSFLLANKMTRQYMESTGFPLLLPDHQISSLLESWVLCLALVPPAVALPLVPSLARYPNKLLQGATVPRTTRALAWAHWVDRLVGRFTGLRHPERIGLRNVVRRPFVFMTSTLCISGMLVVSASMYTFAEGLEDGLAQYLSGHRWNYLVELVRPIDEPDLQAFLADAGADSWEPLRLAIGTLRHRGHERTCRLVAGIVPSALHEEKAMVDGRFLQRDEDPDIVIDLRTALGLEVRVGDEIDVASAGPPVRLRVAGIVSNYTVNQAFVSPYTLARVAESARRPVGALLTGPPAVAAHLGRRSEVARLVPGDLVARAGTQNFQAVSAFLRIYGNLGVLAGAVLVLVFVRMSIDDRAGEYALLRSQGFSTLELLRSLLVEVFAIGISAILLSFPLTRLVTWIFQIRLMALSDWYPLHTSFAAWLRLMGPALLLMLLSSLPALHRAMQIRAAEVLRARFD